VLAEAATSSAERYAPAKDSLMADFSAPKAPATPKRLSEHDMIDSTPGGRLRELIRRNGGLLLPGAANALTVRIVEDLGFDAAYVTGAGVTNAFLGIPDLGFISLSEIAAHARRRRGVGRRSGRRDRGGCKAEQALSRCDPGPKEGPRSTAWWRRPRDVGGFRPRLAGGRIEMAQRPPRSRYWSRSMRPTTRSL
jgi:hypothetical protein